MPDDGPADERCETCHRLDPINCPCPPEETAVRYIETPSISSETADVLVQVADERVRQVEKWGVQSWPDGTGVNAMDVHFASMAKGMTDRAAAEGSLTWRLILSEEVAEAYAETDPARLREELLQVAAVAVSWVEDIDRKDADAADRDATIRDAWLGR